MMITNLTNDELKLIAEHRISKSSDKLSEEKLLTDQVKEHSTSGSLNPIEKALEYLNEEYGFKGGKCYDLVDIRDIKEALKICHEETIKQLKNDNK